jgi:S1-C subfamily serine protease
VSCWVSAIIKALRAFRRAGAVLAAVLSVNAVDTQSSFAQGTPSQSILSAFGVLADRSGEAGRIEQIQSDLSWLGLHRGQIHGRMDAATQTSIRDFQQGLGNRSTGTLSTAEIATLNVRARLAEDEADFVTETLNWHGMRLSLPRGHFPPLELNLDDPTVVVSRGQGVARPLLSLGRVETRVRASQILDQLRSHARTNKAQIIVDGVSGTWAYMVSIEDGQRSYSLWNTNGTDFRFLNLNIDESSAVFMRPLVGKVLQAFQPYFGQAVPESEYRARILSGEYPGGRNQPAWLRNMIANGSGSIVSFEGHVLTNHHVIEGCKRLTVNGEAAILIGTDIFRDLAVLAVPGLSGREPVRFAESPARLGDEIVVLGYPVFELSPALNATTGVISSEVGFRGDRSRHQITAPVQPGNSGGPALSVNGQQIGVVVAKITSAVQEDQNIENIGYIIRGREAQSFLDRFGVPFLKSAPSAEPRTMTLGEAMRSWRRIAVRVECQGR